jgi:hypothetical protein
VLQQKDTIKLALIKMPCFLLPWLLIKLILMLSQLLPSLPFLPIGSKEIVMGALFMSTS